MATGLCKVIIIKQTKKQKQPNKKTAAVQKYFNVDETLSFHVFISQLFRLSINDLEFKFQYSNSML